MENIRLKEQSIQTKQESIAMLIEANKEHKEVIEALDLLLKQLKEGDVVVQTNESS